jgi:sulfate permease, SulP family
MSWSEVGEIAGGHHLLQILAGLGFATALWLSQRIRNPLTFPALLVATVVLVHAVRVASGYSIEAAREAGWLLNVGRNSEIANPLMLLHAVQAIDLHTAALAGGEFIGLFAVTAITLLLGLVVVEVEGRLDVDLDRELRLNGLANILVGLSICGGSQAYLGARCCQRRSSWMRVLARTASFLATAMRATFAGFPLALIRL